MRGERAPGREAADRLDEVAVGSASPATTRPSARDDVEGVERRRARRGPARRPARTRGRGSAPPGLQHAVAPRRAPPRCASRCGCRRRSCRRRTIARRTAAPRRSPRRSRSGPSWRAPRALAADREHVAVDVEHGDVRLRPAGVERRGRRCRRCRRRRRDAGTAGASRRVQPRDQRVLPDPVQPAPTSGRSSGRSGARPCGRRRRPAPASRPAARSRSRNGWCPARPRMAGHRSLVLSARCIAEGRALATSPGSRAREVAHARTARSRDGAARPRAGDGRRA